MPVRAVNPLGLSRAGYSRLVFIAAVLLFVFYVVYYISVERERHFLKKISHLAPSEASNVTVPIPMLDIVDRRHLKVIWPALKEFEEVRGSYPVYQPLLSLVEGWNPDTPEPPGQTFSETLMHFNYSDPKERQMAEAYRNAEIPFKLYDIPDINQVSQKWTDYYMAKTLKRLSPHTEQSTSNHFMFWNSRSAGVAKKTFEPPTTFVSMSFTDFLEQAKIADETGLSANDIHFYYMVGTQSGDRAINEDLTLFSTKENNFFITNVRANKGIQCRFGMRGIIAESHFDAGRNMVAMFRGAKRYIINPPSACSKLSIISDVTHPSYRHSVLDWSDTKQAKASGFGDVPAIDTIVRAGEILYIPSYWFHYIVSLEYSVQCNSRSGSPPNQEGEEDISKCMGSSFMQKKKRKKFKPKA